MSINKFLPFHTVHGVLKARMLKWFAIPFSSGSLCQIARRNINKLRYADDTTLMSESNEELQSLLMKEKEESKKTGLKLNIQKTKIVASGLITSWQTD